MTEEEIQAELNAQKDVIVTAHEGSMIAHHLIACRPCCIQHFVELQRDRTVKVVREMVSEWQERESHGASITQALENAIDRIKKA